MASDDGFREIQLSGKQLVFLFMATTAVAVVIFLCGVMVGRGVKSATPASSAAAAVPPLVPDTQRTAAETPAKGAPATSAAQGNATDAKPGQPPAEDLTYYSRLEGGKPPAENLKKPAPPADPPDVPKEEPAPSAAKPAAPALSSSVPAEDGWTVQVIAAGEQSQADAIVKQLAAKGYAAFVVPPPPGGLRVFRVRVGRFKEKSEAEAVKRRLEKEEQFKPFITR
jgi:cell division septation protein DedD